MDPWLEPLPGGAQAQGRGHGTSSPSSRSRAPVQDRGGAREEAARGPACSGHLWSSRGHRRDLVSEVVPFRGSTAAGEERGGGERWRQEEYLDGQAVVLPGEAGTPTRGQVGGEDEWNEGDLVSGVARILMLGIHCHKKITAGPRAGTTHLRVHLESCPARHAPIGPKQQKLRLTKGEGGKVNMENVIFDQEKARRDLALMICEHEYPLSIVEHSGFRRFCSSL